MSKNIYIYYEYYKREFLSNLLLGVIASKKNFNIYIGSNDVFNILHKKKLISPGIFHTKSLSHGPKKTNFHKDLRKKKFLITVQDQEHGVINKSTYFDNFHTTTRIQEEDLKSCSAYFCWGNFDFKHLKNRFKKKVFYLTGSPRVDLWKTKFDNLWIRSKIKNKYFLFVSNYSLANNHYSFEKIIRRKKFENYYIRSPNLKKMDLAIYEYQTKSMKRFINLIINFSKKFPNESIIVRPHPTEKKELWEEKLRNCKNISIKPDGDLSSYIKNAKCVVQDGCTSAMESFIRNIPVINFVPLNTNKHAHGYFVKKMSINIRNEKNFFKIIRSKKYKVLKDKKRLVNDRMNYLGKKLSATKITEIWSNLFKRNNYLKNNNKKFINNNSSIYFYLLIFQNLRSFLTTIILFLKRKSFLKSQIYHKNQKLNLDDINRKITILAKSINTQNNVNVSKLGKDLILISSKDNS